MAANVHVSGTGKAGSFGQNSGNSVRLQPSVDTRIAMVEPAETPNLTLYNAIGNGVSINSPEHTVQEEWPINHIAVGTAVEPLAETTIAMADTTMIIPTMTLINIRTGEQMYVQTVASTTSITVVRAFGTTAEAATAAGDRFMILSPAPEEGQDRIQNLMRATGSHINYAQKFAHSTGITDIMELRAVYGPKEEARLNTQMIAEMKKKMNRSYLFGEPKKDTAGTLISGTHDVYVTGGVIYWAKLYNNITLPGAVTYNSLMRALAAIFRFGGKAERWGVGSTRVMQTISQLLPQTVQVNSTMSENTLGIEVTRIKGVGISALNLVADYTFDEEGLDDMLVVEDLNYIDQGIYEPWTAQPDVQTPGAYRKEWQVFTRRMLIQRLPISSGVIDGISYAA